MTGNYLIGQKSVNPPGGDLYDKTLSGWATLNRNVARSVSPLGLRLRWVLDNRPTSARSLSLRAGLSQSHVGQVVRGSIGGGIAPDSLAKIAELAQVDYVWLSTGKGTPELTESTAPEALPRRAAAAELAREEGVSEEAILNILAEPPPEGAEVRSTLWWTDRMRRRELEILGQEHRGPASAARPTQPPAAAPPEKVGERRGSRRKQAS